MDSDLSTSTPGPNVATHQPRLRRQNQIHACVRVSACHRPSARVVLPYEFDTYTSTHCVCVRMNMPSVRMPVSVMLVSWSTPFTMSPASKITSHAHLPTTFGEARQQARRVHHLDPAQGKAENAVELLPAGSVSKVAFAGDLSNNKKQPVCTCLFQWSATRQPDVREGLWPSIKPYLAASLSMRTTTRRPPLQMSFFFHGSFAATTASNSAPRSVWRRLFDLFSNILGQLLTESFMRVARPKMTAPYTALPPGAVSQKPSVKMMTGCRD